MPRKIFSMRLHTPSLYCVLLSAVTALQCIGAEKGNVIPDWKINQSAVAVFSPQGGIKPTVISHLDLTEQFRTATQWTFVAVQDAGLSSSEFEDHGPVHVCFVKASHPDCTETFYQQSGKEDRPFDTPHQLIANRIVYSGQNQSSPLLLIKLCGTQSFNGNCGIATGLYQYDRGADRFFRVFLNLTGRNNNEATRFVERGPLQGAVIVNYPTENAPYTYWIEVYRAEKSGQFVQVLRYRGRTRYGDGNALAVSDSEMPVTLSHFGLWKSGDALPVPAHMPKGCNRLYMRQGEEWCR